MTHAEALYAYNQYAAMQEFIDGAEMALTLGALDVEELPELLELHVKACDQAIFACQEHGWRDYTPELEEQRKVLTTMVEELREPLRKLRRQKQR